MITTGLICQSCNYTDNPASARFCSQCGARLATLCPRCGATNPPGFRFCGQCAAPLSATSILRSTRRVVSILFADICNSTSITTVLGAEAMYACLDDCLRRLSEAVRRFEGTIDKITGDGLMAVFGVPVALEQHAIQATYAALAMFDELARFNAEMGASHNITFQIRVGITSGEVVAGELGSDLISDRTVIGDAVNLAARLQQHAEPNSVLLDEHARQLVAPLFDLTPVVPLTLKGFVEPVPAFVLRGKREQPGLLRGLSGQRTPLVGRQLELRQLESTLAPLREGKGAVITLLGEAGMGKSRLTHEFIAQCEQVGIRVLEGDCFSHTRSVPYSAFIGVVRDFCGLLPTDNRGVVQSKISAAVHATRISNPDELIPYLEYLLSLDLVDEQLIERVRHLDPAQLKRQLFLALRNLLYAEARQHPVLVVLDDLHWADDLSIELIPFLAESLAEVPLLLALIARNDGQSRLHSLFGQVAVQAGEHQVQIQLEPLSGQELRQMAYTLLPHAGRPLIDQLVNHAEGIPFYLEELVRHTQESSTHPLPHGGSAPPNAVPPSLDALIRARYDRLPEPLQITIATAAVIGRRFDVALLKTISNPTTIDAHLAELRERAFVRPRTPDGDQWTFMHILTQETIYKGLMNSSRQQLHATVGRTLEAMSGERIDEQVDILAYHFTRANNIEKAIPYLLRAARRAAGRFANNEALRLYEEASTLLTQHQSAGGTEWIQLEQGRADVLTLIGQYDAAREAYLRALTILQNHPTPNPSEHAALERRIATTYERQSRYEDAQTHLEAARHALGSSDRLERARINCDAGWVAFCQGHLEEAQKLLRMALGIAELGRDRSLKAQVYNRMAGVHFRYGELDNAKAMLERSLELSRQLDDQTATARALSNLGIIAQNQANWAEAEDYYTQSRDIYIRNGDIEGQVRTTLNAASAALMRGRLREAMRALDTTIMLAQRVGIKQVSGMSRSNQGRIALLQGEFLAARRALVEAWIILRDVKSHQADRADVAEMLGRIALRHGKLRMALLLARRALALATHEKGVMEIFRAQRLVALAHSFKGNFAEADRIFAELEVSESAKDPFECAHLLIAQAMHAQNQDHEEEAAMLHQKAHTLFDDHAIPAALRRFF